MSGLLLAAANAAGLTPAAPPTLKSGPRGVAGVLLCHGGHVALHAVPETGECHADVAGFGTGPRRGLDIIIRRLAPREMWTDTRRRTSAAQSSTRESR